MSIYLGIDFGTSTNYIVRWDNDKKDIMEEQFGEYGKSNVIPNVIYYKKDDRIIGSLAEKVAGKADNLNLVRYIKRQMDKENWTTYVPALQKQMTAKEISTDIFKEIKKKVEFNHGGERIDGAVISVPFAFLYKERQKIRNAAMDAGINVLEMIEEPVAAAIRSLDFQQKLISNQYRRIMVLDLGGGTLDVTLFSCERQENDVNIEVLNTDGNKELGGKDVTDALVEHFLKSVNFDISSINNKTVRDEILLNLENEADSAKKEISDYDEYNVFCNIDSIELDFDMSDKDLEKVLTLNNFINEIKIKIEDVVYDIDLEFKDIDDVVLVGGSSKLKIIREIILDLFGKEPIKLDNPDRLVGEGAALYCGNVLNNNFKYNIVHRLSQSIGIENCGKFIELIPKNSLYNEKSKIYWINNNKKDDIFVDVYQGNTSDITKCSKIERISIPCLNSEKNQIGLEFMLNKHGVIEYTIYTEDESLNLKVINQGELNG